MPDAIILVIHDHLSPLWNQEIETMPTDACLFFYECTGCRVRLRPKPGDCCVFCSYGDVPCPPKQALPDRAACCSGEALP